MSLHRRAAKRDQSEAEVIEALEACGWCVRRVSQAGMPDLFVWKRIRSSWVESKTGEGKLRKSQEWWAEQGFPVVVLRNAEDVLAWNRNQ